MREWQVPMVGVLRIQPEPIAHLGVAISQDFSFRRHAKILKQTYEKNADAKLEPFKRVRLSVTLTVDPPLSIKDKPSIAQASREMRHQPGIIGGVTVTGIQQERRELHAPYLVTLQQGREPNPDYSPKSIREWDEDGRFGMLVAAINQVMQTYPGYKLFVLVSSGKKDRVDLQLALGVREPFNHTVFLPAFAKALTEAWQEQVELQRELAHA